jgi:hypothetical protein
MNFSPFAAEIVTGGFGPAFSVDHRLQAQLPSNAVKYKVHQHHLLTS